MVRIHYAPQTLLKHAEKDCKIATGRRLTGCLPNLGDMNESKHLAIKWLIENTGLYFFVQNKNEKYISDWGRVIRVESDGVIHFSRYQHRRATGGYKDALMDCFTSTTMEFSECEFYLYTDLSTGWREEYRNTKTYEELQQMIIRQRSLKFKLMKFFKILNLA